MKVPLMLVYGGVILCLVLAYLVMRGSARPAAVDGFVDGAGAGSPQFVMVYTDQCHYCREAKPSFQELMKSKLNIGKHTVAVRLVEASSDEINKFTTKIDGYPTFILIKPDGREVLYTGKRTVDGYKEFLTEELNPKHLA